MAYNLEAISKKKTAEVARMTGEVLTPETAEAAGSTLYTGSDQQQHVTGPGEPIPNSATIEAPRGEVVEGEGRPNTPDAPPVDGPVVKDAKGAKGFNAKGETKAESAKSKKTTAKKGK